MNRLWCEREGDVVRCLRMGSLSPEMRDHVLSCAVCAEAQGAAQVMLQTAALLRVEDGLPVVDLVWRRAQARKRESEMKRATRPLILMRVLSAVYVVVCARRGLHSFWHSVSMELVYGLNALRDSAVGFGAAVVLLAIAIGAWYLLHDSRRSDAGIAST
jgi:hypothetical protein